MKMLCASCNSTIEQGDTFCSVCGYKFHQEILLDKKLIFTIIPFMLNTMFFSGIIISLNFKQILYNHYYILNLLPFLVIYMLIMLFFLVKQRKIKKINMIIFSVFIFISMLLLNVLGIGLGILAIILNLPKSSEMGGDHPSEEILKKNAQDAGTSYRTAEMFSRGSI